MIKRAEARATRDEERKHQAGKHFPEEPHAKRLGGPAESNLQMQPPRPAHAAIGKRGKRYPERHCDGAESCHHPQNTAAPGKSALRQPGAVFLRPNLY